MVVYICCCCLGLYICVVFLFGMVYNVVVWGGINLVFLGWYRFVFWGGIDWLVGLV